MHYQEFLAQKGRRQSFTGLRPTMATAHLFPFQAKIVQWAVEKGRAAIWCDTGLGKTRQQLYWAQHVVEQTGDVLILAPLSVGAQTQREARSIGIEASVVRDASEVQPGISITNYERLHRMPLERFSGIVLDESSILKAFDGKTREYLTSTCAHIPFRLCCTATPAPNDHIELANHAEFLGVMSRQEMLSSYFVHDGGATSQWRLKGHAVEPFWQWVASWAVALTHPRQLGDCTPGYDLPPLEVFDHPISSTGFIEGSCLFPMDAYTLQDQRAAKRAGLMARVDGVAQIVKSINNPWVVWCDLNDEGDALARAIPGSIQIAGKDPMAIKEQRMQAFLDGEARVLISKIDICGFGINMQHCAHMAFVGVGHSFEKYYQGVRRCWRFGQQRSVQVHRWYLDIEIPVVRNLAKKDAEAQAMKEGMEKHLLQFFATQPRATYVPTQAIAWPEWLTNQEINHGICV